MLKRFEVKEIQELQSALLKEPLYNLRVSALIDAYGVDQSFFNVWHENFKSVVASLDGSFFICESDNDNLDELKEFLSFSPGVLSISGKKETVDKLGLSYSKRTDFFVMEYKNSCDAKDIETEKEPKLTDIYKLISESGSDDLTVGSFNGWYADMSHRIRHGCAKAYLLKNNKEAVSALIVSAMSQKAGLISGVVTDKEHRGRGYASRLLLKACFDLNAEGRFAVAECSQKLIEFYKKSGFAYAGEYSIIE